MRRCRSIWLGLAVLVSGPGLAAAQQQLSPRWEIPGLDFHPDGVWRVRARSIARARAALLGRRDFSSLNAPLERALAVSGAPAVTGTLLVPAILLRYKDTNLATLRDTAQYSAVLFGATPPAGRPFTVRTYYEELSRGLFSMQGQVLGWAGLDSNEATYTGPAGGCFGNPFGTSNCNGIFSASAIVSMQNGMAEALAEIDSGSAIDWGQFDNDGPDGIPNSGDDDGYVDMAIFVHPAQDGACGGSTNNHIWSHRYQLITPYVTRTPWAGHPGQFIKVRDYTFQSGVGGSTACDTSQIMPAGTAAHESGHGLGLPDLYDLTFVTEGIGEWGIMGSGNYATPLSPARMEAWSLGELGWVTLAPATVGGTYTLGPSPQSDSAFVVRPTGTNPRGEYFLVENRQRLGSDSAMIRVHCARSNNPPGCGGGLFIWHVDSMIAADNGFRQNNQMNSLAIHGLALEEADGLRQLWCDGHGCNRGDGGDPYPGTSGNVVFSVGSVPAASMNSDSSFTGFAIDSIRQLVPNGAMAFRVRFGQPTVVAASDTAAQVQVDGVPVTVFRDLLDDGSTHTLAVADTQFAAGGRTRFVFQSWSDGLPIAHSITGSLAGATYTATLVRAHRLDVAKSGNGSVASNPAADTNGVFVTQGTPVTLTATAVAPSVFGRWQGDTSTGSSVLVLPMERPYNITAVFDPQLVIAASGPLGSGEVGNAYAASLTATGGAGTYVWSMASGTLPAGLTLKVGGQISGTPGVTGKFVFTVRVTSGPQQELHQDSITVTAPTLALGQVLGQLLTGTGTLSPSDLAYLDFIGNGNNHFDVGDFLAWVQLTGATPSSPAGRQAIAAARRGARP